MKTGVIFRHNDIMTKGDRCQNDSGPSPDPSPEGKGSDHRDTPMGRM